MVCVQLSRHLVQCTKEENLHLKLPNLRTRRFSELAFFSSLLTWLAVKTAQLVWHTTSVPVKADIVSSAHVRPCIAVSYMDFGTRTSSYVFNILRRQVTK